MRIANPCELRIANLSESMRIRITEYICLGDSEAHKERARRSCDEGYEVMDVSETTISSHLIFSEGLSAKGTRLPHRVFRSAQSGVSEVHPRVLPVHLELRGLLQRSAALPGRGLPAVRSWPRVTTRSRI